MNLLWSTVEITATGIENFIILSTYNKIMECKYKGIKKKILFFLFLIITTYYVTFLNQFMLFEGGFSLITIFLFVLYGILCLNGNIAKKILIPIGMFSLILCINMFVILSFTTLLNITLEEIIEAKNLTRILTLFITKFMFYIVSEILMHFFRTDSFKLKRTEMVLNIILIILTYSIGLNAIGAQIGDSDHNLLGLISIFCIVINVCVFYMLRKLTKENKRETQIKFLKLQLSEQKVMIEDASNIGREIRTAEHDMKHHLLSVLGLLENHDNDAAKEYIKKTLGQYESIFQRYITMDSSAINGVLNFKISRCRSKQIDTKIVVESDFELFDELDICVLLSNLFDNAIEASGYVENPKIEISITNNGNYLCILVRNKIGTSVLKHNNMLTTTKPDIKSHGWGLYSVSEIVKKYDGMKDIYEKNGFFVVDIMLKRRKFSLSERIREETNYQTRQNRYQTRHSD